MSRNEFLEDIDRFIEKLTAKSKLGTDKKLKPIRERLRKLNQRKLVKINHSILELLCAWSLIEQGYEVEVEKRIDESILIADIVARFLSSNGNGENHSLLIEVETGFVPPSAAIIPKKYRMVRITSKIARYSGHKRKFALATPEYHVLQIPFTLLKEPQHRSQGELTHLKLLCDEFYQDPPVMLEDLRNAEIDKIYLLDVDDLDVRTFSASQYLELLLSISV